MTQRAVESAVEEPQLRLLIGNAYRCERALAERERVLRAADAGIERRVLFGDEVDPASFGIDVQSASLFALGRHFLVRQVDRAKAPKALVAALEAEIPADTYVTLLARELKTTHPILKALKKRDAVLSFPEPKGRSVTAAAREILAEAGVEASPDAVRRLVFRNGGDLVGIAQEAAKLRTFAPDEPLTEETVERMVFPSAERTVYPFFDRLGERDLSEALSALATLRDDPGRILGGAIRHLARLAMVRAVLDEKGPRRSVSDALGLPDWMCRNVTAQAKAHTIETVSRALRIGLGLDVRVKSGEIRPNDALFLLALETAGSRR
jgi:DNA polymerase III delta subunit